LFITQILLDRVCNSFGVWPAGGANAWVKASLSGSIRLRWNPSSWRIDSLKIYSKSATSRWKWWSMERSYAWRSAVSFPSGWSHPSNNL